MLLQVPDIEAVATDGRDDVGDARVALNLLHFHRAYCVHFAAQVGNLRLLEHLSRMKE